MYLLFPFSADHVEISLLRLPKSLDEVSMIETSTVEHGFNKNLDKISRLNHEKILNNRAVYNTCSEL